ncbi:hypothetical protein IKU74_02775 [bacterium]|nr:hypothetical protein [bacterium]
MDMQEIFENGCFSPAWLEVEEKEIYVPQKKDLTVLLAELEEIKNSIDDIKAKQWHLAKLMQFHQKGLANE